MLSCSLSSLILPPAARSAISVAMADGEVLNIKSIYGQASSSADSKRCGASSARRPMAGPVSGARGVDAGLAISQQKGAAAAMAAPAVAAAACGGAGFSGGTVSERTCLPL